MKTLTYLILMLIAFTFIAMPQKTQKAPNFSLYTYDKKVIELARLKGKVVLLNFWATWCPPCIEEIPDFIKVYEKYKSKNFVIIGIAKDEEGWAKVKPFVDKNKITYPVVLANQNVIDAYGGISAIPTSILIDKNGNVVAMKVGMLSKEQIEYALQKYLN